MGLERTLLKRFTKALIAWVQSNSDLVSLTGHTSGDPRIYVKRGNEALQRPSLIVDIATTEAFLGDVDGLYITEIQMIAYADSRVEALDIAGAVLAMCKQNSTTLVDASFNSDNIRTQSIKALGVLSQGESLLDPTSVRRTERSDVVAPDRYSAVVPVLIVWYDTT